MKCQVDQKNNTFRKSKFILLVISERVNNHTVNNHMFKIIILSVYIV